MVRFSYIHRTGGWRYNSTHSWPRHETKVSGQPHTQAILPLR